jgi:hypothetical protein
MMPYVIPLRLSKARVRCRSATLVTRRRRLVCDGYADAPERTLPSGCRVWTETLLVSSIPEAAPWRAPVTDHLGRLGHAALRARVFAAFFAAAFLAAGPLVFAAFFAAADLLADARLAALFLAWAESARFEAAAVPSRFSAFVVARFLAVDFFVAMPADRFLAAFVSWAAFFFVALLAVFPGFASTPARRALDRPMAMACFADRAPCFPSRMCSISSCTYSPAWVDADLPSRLSRAAFAAVFFSGMVCVLGKWADGRAASIMVRRVPGQPTSVPRDVDVW